MCQVVNGIFDFYRQVTSRNARTRRSQSKESRAYTYIKVRSSLMHLFDNPDPSLYTTSEELASAWTQTLL